MQRTVNTTIAAQGLNVQLLTFLPCGSATESISALCVLLYHINIIVSWQLFLCSVSICFVSVLPQLSSTSQIVWAHLKVLEDIVDNG